MKAWLAIAAAACVAILAIASALSSADKRADKAEAAVGIAKGEAKVARQQADTNAAVSEATSTQADVQVRVERVTHTVIRKIEASPDADTPIPPDLARDWVAGLHSMCDEAGPGACADGGANRVERPAGDEPLPAGDAPRGGRVDGGRGDDLRE